MVSVAALPRATPTLPPPYRVAWRTTSWLDSTQVGAVEAAATAAIDSVIPVAN